MILKGDSSMAQLAKNIAEKPKAKKGCCHHWVIESPKGPTSKGVCKYCGAEREFLNYWADFFWEDDLSMLDNVPQNIDSARDLEAV